MSHALDRAMPLRITLDASEKDPLFLQIAARVRAAIAAGHLLPGARLPSSRALAAQLAIARGTVDAAYALLTGEGCDRNASIGRHRRVRSGWPPDRNCRSAASAVSQRRIGPDVGAVAIPDGSTSA